MTIVGKIHLFGWVIYSSFLSLICLQQKKRGREKKINDYQQFVEKTTFFQTAVALSFLAK